MGGTDATSMRSVAHDNNNDTTSIGLESMGHSLTGEDVQRSLERQRLSVPSLLVPNASNAEVWVSDLVPL